MPIRITEFAPALLPQSEQAATRPASVATSAPTPGYAPPTAATSWKAGHFTGSDFPLQPDGTLRCPAGSTLSSQERRREDDGSLRVVYAASIRDCRPCPLHEQCQWQGSATKKPRQVSVLLHPLAVGSLPLFWQDWSRRVHLRACMQFLRLQRVTVEGESPRSDNLVVMPALLPRAKLAHARLTWTQRLARNGRPETFGRVTIRLFGVSHAFALCLGLAGG